MYSFAQRSDTIVADEPLYAAYLKANPTIYRPYLEEFISKQDEIEPNNIVSNLYNQLAASNDKSVMLAKHMARHFSLGIESALFAPKVTIGDVEIRVKHVLLIRDPISMIISWDKKLHMHQEKFSLESSCFAYLVQLYSALQSEHSDDVNIIDSDILVRYPEETLTELCEKVGIEYSSSQLQWSAGPKPYDG